jgi:phosphoglycolate phosphatase
VILTAAELVASAQAVLLDFDGPVTLLMPWPRNQEAADAARGPLVQAGLNLPEPVTTTTDHLAVLRYAAALGPDLLAAVEDACISAETLAAMTSAPSAGVHSFLEECREADKPVVIVSNTPQTPFTPTSAASTCTHTCGASWDVRRVTPTS